MSAIVYRRYNAAGVRLSITNSQLGLWTLGGGDYMLFFYDNVDKLILKIEDVAQEIFAEIYGEEPNCKLLLARAELLEALVDQVVDKFRPAFHPNDGKLRSHLNWMKGYLRQKQWRNCQLDAYDFIHQDIPLLKQSIREFFISKQYLAFPTAQSVREEFPSVFRILDDAYNDLFGTPPAQDYVAKVGYSCRDALKLFAAAIYQPEYCPAGQSQPTEEQYKLRFRYFLRANKGGGTLEAFAEAHCAYLESLITFANALGHNQKVDRTRIERVLLHTYLIIESTWEFAHTLET